MYVKRKIDKFKPTDYVYIRHGIIQ